jgi:hypothetical protein
MLKQYGTLAVCAACLLLGAYTSTRGQQSELVQAKPSANSATVEMHLTILDEKSGFTLEAKKDVPRGTDGFDALKQVVVVDYKRVPGIGPFVTSLCGIEASRDRFWAIYVDDEFSKKGIGSIKLDTDTKIEWKTQSRDTFAQ